MRSRVLYSLLMVWALAFPALAQDRGRPSLDRVLPEIRRTTPGRFYDAEGPFFSPNGQATYRIKWMTPEGRIIWFDADARTGSVIRAVPQVQRENRFREDFPRDRFRNDDGPDRFRDGGWPRRDDDGDRWRRRDWNDRNGNWGGRGGGGGDWRERGGNRGGGWPGQGRGRGGRGGRGGD